MTILMIFDRDDIQPDLPYDLVLKAIIENQDNLENRAIARNLIHDHRVSEERANNFHPYFVKAFRTLKKQSADVEIEDLVESLVEVLRVYYREKVNQACHPAFALPRLNKSNLLKHRQITRPAGAPTDDVMLINALDLNQLMPLYEIAGSKARDYEKSGSSIRDLEWIKTFKDFYGYTAVEPWLTQMLGMESSDSNLPTAPLSFVPNDAQKTFVEHLLLTIKAARRGWSEFSGAGKKRKWSHFHPSWVALRDEFKAASGWEETKLCDPAQWLKTVGVSKPKPKHWIILLVYPVKKVKVLARPTVLDSNCSPRHFPSPPCSNLVRGGHPINLADPIPDPTPISEFIHKQIDLEFDYWKASNFAIGRTSSAVGKDLEIERKIHRERLANEFGRRLAASWMREVC